MLSPIETADSLRGILAEGAITFWIIVGGALIALIALLALRLFSREAPNTSSVRPRVRGSRADAYANQRTQLGGKRPERLQREVWSTRLPARVPDEEDRAGSRGTELLPLEPGLTPTQPRPAEPMPERLAPLTAAAHEEGLRRALQDPDPFVRVALIAGLVRQHGGEDLILEALDDEFPVVRREAVRALLEIGGPRAALALSHVVQRDPSAEVREEAVSALATLINRRPSAEQPRAEA